MIELDFALEESFELGGDFYRWRLKDGELRFRGRGRFHQLVLRRITATEEQTTEFLAALDLLDVWSWKGKYDPAGMTVLDGSVWRLKVQKGGRTCHSCGHNAYPQLVNPQQTTMRLGRYGMLVAAMYDAFEIDGYIAEASRLRANR